MIASFASSDRRPCDVENLLLYNVGSVPFHTCAGEDVVLARSFASPAPSPDGHAGVLGHHHRYRLAVQAPAGPSGEVVARFPAVALRRPVTVEKVWYDLRASGQVESERPYSGRPLRLDLGLQRPPRPASPSMLGLVKVIVDGVVSALHTHDASHLAPISERLGRRLRTSPAEVAILLTANPSGVLGERRLVWPFRDFVQWNPADDAIAYVQVTTSASAAWQLSGEVRALKD